MSIEAFIQAMPKVELNVRLDGLFRKETLLTIADQNEIPATLKRFNDWVQLLDKPDYKRLDEIIRTVSQWLQVPEDLTRLVYDVGVMLAKQNVRYAEVLVNPVTHMLPGSTFEDFLAALNDGRDRVLRGWGVQMGWVLVVPRQDPRRADEISRWASSAMGKKGGVVGFGLIGPDDAQPAAQFERAFTTVEKKDVPSIVQVGYPLGGEAIIEALEHLRPDRVVDGWGSADAPDVLERLAAKENPLAVSMARALCLGWVDSYKSYPLRYLFDEGVKVVLSSDMPSYFKTTLTDEYLAAVEHCEITVDELEQIALNAVEASFLPPSEKEALHNELKNSYTQLREEHVPA